MYKLLSPRHSNSLSLAQILACGLLLSFFAVIDLAAGYILSTVKRADAFILSRAITANYLRVYQYSVKPLIPDKKTPEPFFRF